MQEHSTTGNAPGRGPDQGRNYFELFAGHWRLIAKVTGAAFIVSIVVAFQVPKIYSSTALILPPQQDSSVMGMLSMMSGGVGGLAGDLLGKGSSSDQYVGLLNSHAIMDPLIDRFKLTEVYKADYRLDTYDELDKHSTIEAGKKDGIISITVEDKDPKRAADLANAYVEELDKLAVRLSTTGAGQNRAYWDERLTKAKADLVRAEEALKNFQKQNKALDVPDQAKASIMTVAQLKAQLAVQEVQLAALRNRFADSDQDVKDMRASVNNLRAQIARVEGGEKGSSIPSIGSVPELGQQYIRLLRDFKVQETIFETLTKQYEMAILSESKRVSGIQIVQPARVPDKKIKPKRAILILMSTFGTFLFALTYLVALDWYQSLPEEKIARWRRLLAKGDPANG